MTGLTEKEKKELLRMSRSKQLREDSRRISRNRHNPFLTNGKPDLDKYVEFLNCCSDFAGHKARPFKKIKDKISIL